MVASPFGPFKVKVNGFLRKAFCLEPEFHFDIADVSSPYFLGPKRKTFAYHKSVIKPRPMGSYWSDYSDPADNNPAIRTFELLHGHGVIDETFKSAVDTSKKLGQAEVYGKLTNQNPYGHWAPNDSPTSVYYDAPLAPTPYMTPNLIPKSLPATPKMGSSNLSATCTTDIFYDANDF